MEKRLGIVLSILLLILLAGGISAEKLGIEIEKNNYKPGEEVSFRLILYDDGFNKIEGEIGYEVQNFYTEVISEGKVSSGEIVDFKLPYNAIKGHWGIIAKYREIEKKELFNVMELEKIEIRLEGDELVISNIGNVPVSAKQISISIGEHDETVLVSLEVGQEKRIRLTAPAGEYNIRVSDGTEENTFEVKGVSLTGKVIGLEKVVDKSFWEEYPLVIMFVFIIVIIFLIILGIRFRERYFG